MLWLSACACACLALALLGGSRAGPACSVAEFSCRNARCVRLDHFCDGADHCGDGSDEPPHCTVCNRTYYGHVGATYALRVREARRVPFLCHLTLTAGGGGHGDIVQLTFEQFAVGRYEPDALDGCPDGYMQLSELGRPFTGGSWCGASAGSAVYFSETATVTVSVKLFRARPGVAFQFRLRYKFVAQHDAVVRFGPASAPLERGAVSPGTYCTRTYEECYRKPCRLQSPNWPGMYPRNVTCYWSVRQKDVPTCKHAMVGVRQEAAHKVHIKRSLDARAALNKTRRALRAWRDCTGERDRLIFYDGPSTDDPVLLEYCGGDWLPRIVSRGPEMLVAFHSSPFSAPLHAPIAAASSAEAAAGGASSAAGVADEPSPASALRGFELDVDVMFADSDSLDYAREARRCEFHVKASSAEEETDGALAGGLVSAGNGAGAGGVAAAATSAQNGAGGGGAGRGRRGILHAPAHTLPPNTTCTWTFHGRPGDVVWIYFSSYVQYSLVEPRRVDADPPEPPTPPAPPDPAAPDFERERDRPGTDRSDASPWARLREMLRARPARPTAAPSTLAPRTAAPAPCATSLRIWDGGGEGEPQALLVGRYCEEGPRTCARAALANATRSPRPCAGADGVVSRGALLALTLATAPGTATHPLSFALHYEFVDARLGGSAYEPPPAPTAPRPHPPACARLYTQPGEIVSPRNVLWLGRGGGARLHCVFRVEAPRGQRVRLTLAAAAFGSSGALACSTRPHTHTGRPSCVAAGAALSPMDDHEWGAAAEGPGPGPDVDAEAPRVAQLRIFDSPWPGYRVPLACLCDNWTASAAPLTVLSGAHALELHFVVSALRAAEDHRHLYFRASWTAERQPHAATPCASLRRLHPPGARLALFHPSGSGEDGACGETPFLLSARGNRSVFLRIWGEPLSLAPPPDAAASTAPAPPASEDAVRCRTANRLLVYSVSPVRLLKAVCPGEPDSPHAAIHLFSGNWLATASARVTEKGADGGGGALMVVWVPREPGRAAFSWMEVWHERGALLGRLRDHLDAAAADLVNETTGPGAAAGDCPHVCPELEACASGALWCDGVADCPRGGDEEGAACGAGRRLLARLGGAGGALAAAVALAGGALLALTLLVLGAARRRRAPALSDKRKHALAARRLTDELLCDASLASSTLSS